MQILCLTHYLGNFFSVGSWLGIGFLQSFGLVGKWGESERGDEIYISKVPVLLKDAPPYSFPVIYVLVPYPRNHMFMQLPTQSLFDD